MLFLVRSITAVFIFSFPVLFIVHSFLSEEGVSSFIPSLLSNDGPIDSAIAAALISAIVGFIVNLKRERKNKKSAFLNHISSLNLNSDYLNYDGNYGLVIDDTNKKIFIGNIKHGEVVNYTDITEVKKETDTDVKNGIKTTNSRLIIKTNDFKTPTHSIFFAGKSEATEAFEKLRVALELD